MSLIYMNYILKILPAEVNLDIGRGSCENFLGNMLI